MAGRVAKVFAIGMGLLAAFSLGAVSGYRYAESRLEAEKSGSMASKADTHTDGVVSKAQVLAKLQQQVVARQRFAGELQTYFQDRNYPIFVDTRTMPNQTFTGDLHDVLKLNCQVCGKKETAHALLSIATAQKLRDLGFVTFMVGTFQSPDYWVWDVRENKWLEGRQPPQKSW